MTGGRLGESCGGDPLRREAEPAGAKKGPGEAEIKNDFFVGRYRLLICASIFRTQSWTTPTAPRWRETTLGVTFFTNAKLLKSRNVWMFSLIDAECKGSTLGNIRYYFFYIIREATVVALIFHSPPTFLKTDTADTDKIPLGKRVTYSCDGIGKMLPAANDPVIHAKN